MKRRPDKGAVARERKGDTVLALETRGLCKDYGGRRAVDGFDMHVPQGAVYGFVGKNGAGKSTVMKMVCDLAAPTSGSIHLFGEEGVGRTATCGSRVGSLIENPGVLENLNAFDNLMCKALALGVVNPKERCREMLRTVGLDGVGKKRVGKFSLGMKQRLGIAFALLGSPDLLLLDEPFNGLDPEGTRELRTLVSDINRMRGVTVVISSHVLDQLDRIATCYGVIADGRMVAELSAEQVETNCGDSLLLKADAPEQALVRLEATFPDLAFSMEPGGYLRVKGCADAERVALVLRDANIAVIELSIVRRDIEDYFVELMEGGRNV